LTILPVTEGVSVPIPAPFIEDSWLQFVIDTIRSFEKDTQHVAPLYHIEEGTAPTRAKTLDLAKKLSKVWPFPLFNSGCTNSSAQEFESRRKAVTGARLLLFSNLLLSYEPSKGDASRSDENHPIQALAECVETVDKVFLFPTEIGKKSKKKEKLKGKSFEDPKPIDLLVDDLIGYLEKSSAFMRVVANRVFEAISGEVEQSTVRFLLTVSTFSRSLHAWYSQYFNAATREPGRNYWRGA
jgi:DNA polymerase phi